jgi:hypothetical protein
MQLSSKVSTGPRKPHAEKEFFKIMQRTVNRHFTNLWNNMVSWTPVADARHTHAVIDHGKFNLIAEGYLEN